MMMASDFQRKTKQNQKDIIQKDKMLPPDLQCCIPMLFLEFWKNTEAWVPPTEILI